MNLYFFPMVSGYVSTHPTTLVGGKTKQVILYALLFNLFFTPTNLFLSVCVEWCLHGQAYWTTLMMGSYHPHYRSPWIWNSWNREQLLYHLLWVANFKVASFSSFFKQLQIFFMYLFIFYLIWLMQNYFARIQEYTYGLDNEHCYCVPINLYVPF